MRPFILTFSDDVVFLLLTFSVFTFPGKLLNLSYLDNRQKRLNNRIFVTYTSQLTPLYYYLFILLGVNGVQWFSFVFKVHVSSQQTGVICDWS